MKIVNILLIITAIVILTACESKQPAENPEFVGVGKCIDCHEFEVEQWTKSHHDLAMCYATDSTVLADFNNCHFVYYGDTAKFYRREDKFYVWTKADGTKPEELEIKYTFGWTPLQQYLVEFPGGRFQVLPFCWDTRPKEEGGQKWFHIYPDEKIEQGDILYWTGNLQNWNYMCAECHSTDLHKNYSFETDSYSTSWKEINVSCEACHGPASNHLLWAELEEEKDADTLNFDNRGLLLSFFDESDNDDNYFLIEEKNLVFKEKVTKDTLLIEICGRCHSRRNQIWDDYHFGAKLTQTHRPVTMNEVLYYPDGQILEEDYVYHSFLQSKMYNSGVKCTDCHDAHNLRVFGNKNDQCNVCHLPAKYDTKEHHFHRADSTGGLCIDCHMPSRTYMVNDPRRDHSFRIPRPDLSLKIGIPNACTKCHPDKSIQWADDAFRKWYGNKYRDSLHFGEVFFSAMNHDYSSINNLIKIIDDKKYPEVIRASAVYYLRFLPVEAAINKIVKSAYDQSDLVRLSALSVLSAYFPNEGINAGFDNLDNTQRSIRLAAFDILKQHNSNNFSESNRTRINKSFEEYSRYITFNYDVSASHQDLASYYLTNNKIDYAIISYENAVKADVNNPVSYINLADVYRMNKMDERCESVLRNALNRFPDNAGVLHAYGLLLIRKKRIDEAMEYIKKSAYAESASARFKYVYAIGLHTQGKSTEAVKVLNEAFKDAPFDTDIITGLATILHETGDKKEAVKYADMLVSYHPNNSEYKQLRELLVK